MSYSDAFDEIIKLETFITEKVKECDRLMIGLQHLSYRATQKPCEKLDLEDIVSRILAGHDYSDRFGAGSEDDRSEA